ncbi:large ribosomal subunit protein mL44 isoform X2 [Halyomorpha halys]|uniref:large ribosomal subunit protein mL44 isoform X2 n=1 Tax=Halyomorpha halys TaxID=286706 RepID=UPI0034D369B9
MSFSLKFLVKPLMISCGNNIVQRQFHRWVAPTLKVLYKRKREMGPEPISRRSDFIEWNYKAEIYAFGKRLGEDFREELLREAFTEKSFINLEAEKLKKVGVDPQLDMKDNSNFSVEGEKFISQCVLQYLVTVLPSLPSEHIKSIHNFLVSDEKLSTVSKNIGIDDLVLSAEYPPEECTLSRTLKGVIHALVLSSGEERASKFVKDFIVTQLCEEDITPLCTPENPIEKLKSTVGTNIESRIIVESAQNSLLANYQVGIYQEKKLIGRGCGESPWIAEEMAALDALWRLWGIPSNKKPFPIKSQKLASNVNM